MKTEFIILAAVVILAFVTIGTVVCAPLFNTPPEQVWRIIRRNSIIIIIGIGIMFFFVLA